MDRMYSERSISALPVSIGTSLAFETILTGQLPPYDPSRVYNKQDIHKYTQVWINIQTLFRNLMGALPPQLKSMAQAHDLAEVLQQEIDILSSSIKEESQSTVEICYYYPTYEKLIKDILLARQVQFRTPNTVNQKLYHELMLSTYQRLKKISNVDIMEVKKLVEPPSMTKGLIFTHCPYDLLSYKDFQKLDLLESHTGLVKSRSHWYSKYYPVGEMDMSVLPFIKPLLMIFGDHTLIKPMTYGYRKTILDIAHQRNWTPLTTESKVRYYLDMDLKERYLFDIYTKLS